MKKMIPYSKLSKKAQREANSQRRAQWGDISPVTKVIPDKREKLRRKGAATRDTEDG